MGRKYVLFILLALMGASAGAEEPEFEPIDEAELTTTSQADPPKQKVERVRTKVTVYDSKPPTREELAARRNKIEEAYRKHSLRKAKRLNQTQNKQSIPVD